MRSGSPSFLGFVLLKYLLNWTEFGNVYTDTLKLQSTLLMESGRGLLIIWLRLCDVPITHFYVSATMNKTRRNSYKTLKFGGFLLLCLDGFSCNPLQSKVKTSGSASLALADPSREIMFVHFNVELLGTGRGHAFDHCKPPGSGRSNIQWKTLSTVSQVIGSHWCWESI